MLRSVAPAAPCSNEVCAVDRQELMRHVFLFVSSGFRALELLAGFQSDGSGQDQLRMRSWSYGCWPIESQLRGALNGQSWDDRSSGVVLPRYRISVIILPLGGGVASHCEIRSRHGDILAIRGGGRDVYADDSHWVDGENYVCRLSVAVRHCEGMRSFQVVPRIVETYIELIAEPRLRIGCSARDPIHVPPEGLTIDFYQRIGSQVLALYVESQDWKVQHDSAGGSELIGQVLAVLRRRDICDGEGLDDRPRLARQFASEVARGTDAH